MTFDNKQELIKVKAHFPSARYLGRKISNLTCDVTIQVGS